MKTKKTTNESSNQNSNQDQNAATRESTSKSKKKATRPAHPTAAYCKHIEESQGRVAACFVRSAMDSLATYVKKVQAQLNANQIGITITWSTLTPAIIWGWEYEQATKQHTNKQAILRKTQNIRDMYTYWEEKGWIERNATDALYDLLTGNREAPIGGFSALA